MMVSCRRFGEHGDRARLRNRLILDRSYRSRVTARSENWFRHVIVHCDVWAQFICLVAASRMSGSPGVDAREMGNSPTVKYSLYLIYLVSTESYPDNG